MLRFTRTKTDTLRFISSVDEAVDTDSPEGLEGYSRYLKTLDESQLVLTGTPTVFVLRPLTHAVKDRAEFMSGMVVMPGKIVVPQTARQLVRMSCGKIEPEPEGWEQSEIYRFENGAQCLTAAIVDPLPGDIFLEGAQVLLETLPEMHEAASGDETDPFDPTAPEG